jgi:hypothetical protein
MTGIILSAISSSTCHIDIVASAFAASACVMPSVVLASSLNLARLLCPLLLLLLLLVVVVLLVVDDDDDDLFFEDMR